MAIQILVPVLGESVVEATVGSWHKQVGDAIAIGDVIVSLETDKVDLEVEAETAGVLIEIAAAEQEDVAIGDVLGVIDGDGAAVPATPVTAAAPVAAAPAAPVAKAADGSHASPVAKRAAAVEGVDLNNVQGSGKDGKIMKADVLKTNAPAPAPIAAAPVATPPAAVSAMAEIFGGSAPREERIKMSRRRRTIAKRLVEAQQTAAMLTTFNEIDMSAVMALRSARKEWFIKKFGTKLGFMSFFTKASIAGLKAFPRINAEIDGDEMVLKYHYDIGIAVGAEEGLVVPVIRDADTLSFAEIENTIKAKAAAARDGSLGLSDLMGGTFTITNGGIFGSMLSTPILNTPQVAILGLHNIVKRAVVVDDEIVIRPIMMVALSYDHRIVDGNEAVRFLYRIKELIEDPEDLLLAG